jgi:hypothetical protein
MVGLEVDRSQNSNSIQIQIVVSAVYRGFIFRREIQNRHELFDRRETRSFGTSGGWELLVRSFDARHDIRVLGCKGLGQTKIDQRVTLINFVTWKSTGSAFRVRALWSDASYEAHDMFDSAINRGRVESGPTVDNVRRDNDCSQNGV